MKKINLSYLSGVGRAALMAGLFYTLGSPLMAVLVIVAAFVLPFTNAFAHLGAGILSENASGANTAMASKIITTFDILKPSVRQQLIRRYGDQNFNFFNLTESLGYSRMVTQRYTTQYEEDWIHQSLHLGGSITQTGTNTYTFVLSTSSPNIDYLEQNVTSPYSSANQYVFPVAKWDILTFPSSANAKLHVTNISISGSTCTVSVTHANPNTSSFVYTSYTSGQEVIKTGNAYAEGSDIQRTQVNKPIIDHAYTQIIKTGFVWTGSQDVSQPWFTEYSDDSGAISTYVVVGQNNTEYEHMMAIDDQLLFGDLTTTSIIDTDTVNGLPNGEPIYTTEGLDSYIKRTGNNLQFTPGTFSVTTFDYLDKILEQNGASSWMAWMCGTEFDNEKDNVLKAYFQNTMQEYMMKQAERDLFTNDPGMAQEVKFRYLDKGQRKWCFGRMPRFNQKKSWGAAGYNTANLSLIYPLGSMPDKKNPSNRIPFMGTIYRGRDGYSRKVNVWTLRGEGPGDKVLSYDRSQLCMLSDIGAEHAGGPQMARLYV